MHGDLICTAEVAQALTDRRPVVALETTIVSHGMPYPQNLEMALGVEQLIRDQGAVPATIGLMEGKIRVGLAPAELERFAASKETVKVSRRDLPFVLASGMNGATTVAGTMIAAALAGIKVFATGGIGGVHRGGETSWDVSADLPELARTNVAVVCAGAKSILDLGRTLQYLETHGVPVVGYQTDEFPSFFARESGHRLSMRIDTPEGVAAMLAAKWRLGLAGGVVIANPVPAADALRHDEMEAIIGAALRDAAEQGMIGPAVTPYLLDRIRQLTGGRSLATNIALVRHNAQVAAQVAVALSGLERCGRP